MSTPSIVIPATAEVYPRPANVRGVAKSRGNGGDQGLSLLLAVAVAVSAPASADLVVPGDEHCVVNVRADDRLNMREGPGTRFGVVARKAHDACGILVAGACRGDWCRVEDGHAVGFVHRHYIAPVSPALYCVSGVAPGDVLNLRAWPSSRSRVTHRIPRRACGIAFLPYEVDGWRKIRVAGREGWASRRYLSGQ